MTTTENSNNKQTAVKLDLPEGIPALRAIYLYMTTGCNLCCKHCWITPTFVDGVPSAGDCIDIDLLRTTIRQAKPLGLESVKLTGGEPMIHPQFKEIAELLFAEELASDMETNGTCIDADMAQFIKEKTSINFISVSLDSVNPASHDKFRGVQGAFDKAVTGIKNLVKVGYSPQVIMCPHRGNINEIDEMAEFVTSIGAGSLKFNPVTNAGRGSSMHDNGEALDYDETMNLIRYVHGDLQKNTKIQLFLGTPLALLSVDNILHDHGKGMCNVRHIMGILGTNHMALCGVGRNIPELCYGELGLDDLRETWINHPLLAEIRTKLDGDYPGICADCIHAYRCRTGCLAMNYMKDGELFSPSVLCEEADRRGEFPITRRRKS